MSNHNGATGAKGKGRASPVKGDALPFNRMSAKWVGFVNVEQTEGTKDQYEAFSRDADLVAEIVQAVLSRGYKLSVVCDGSEDVFKATAYAAFKGMPDEGLAVSAWAASPWEGIAAVSFIVGVQSQGDLSKHYTESTSRRRFTF